MARVTRLASGYGGSRSHTRILTLMVKIYTSYSIFIPLPLEVEHVSHQARHV